MIYVMSDIHGDLVKFNNMLEKISFSSEDSLYILGDMIDRGKFPLTTLIKCIKTDNIYPLMGNHEKMMLEYFEDVAMTNWLYNGGDVTMNQLYELQKENRDHIIKEVRELPYFKVININDKKFILVHAGMATTKDGYVDEIQDEDFMLWARREFYSDTIVNNSHIIIFGHTPTKHLTGEASIWHGENMIGIDCGAVYGGRLGCLRLDDMKEFYI